MKITIVTYGSRGDVQPALALALALMSAGHDVVLAAPPENEEWVKGRGCAFRTLGSNMRAFTDRFPDFYTLEAAKSVVSILRNEFLLQFNSLPSILEGSDLIIGVSIVAPASSIAEAMNIPYLFVALCPQVLPSRFHPNLVFKRHDLPPALNTMTWMVSDTFERMLYGPLINRERSRLGLKPIKHLWRHMLGRHVLLATDKALGTSPSDFRQNVSQVGYLCLSSKESLTPEIERFLADDRPPIFIGFGSMPYEDPRIMANLIRKSVRASGYRAIVYGGWAGIDRWIEDRDILTINEAPHHKLFPRVTLVVHHGGAGTTATAARAGVPQIVVPHLLDQFYWANRVFHLGLGPRSISKKRLSPQLLAAVIRECTDNASFLRNAKAMRESLSRTDSIKEAVNVVNRIQHVNNNKSI